MTPVAPMTLRAELDAAGIEGAALRAGYARCRALSARHGTTFFGATLLLPPAKRPFVHALHGLARHVGELATGPGSTGQRAERVETWSRDFLADLDWGAAGDPVARAALDTITRWAIPTAYVTDFLEAVRADIGVTAYATYDELARHLWGTAALPGLQLLPILGRADNDVRWDVLEAHAIDLGIAFGLTAVLSDLSADLREGRLYLPQESLEQFGVDRDRLRRGRVDESIRNLLAWEIERARRKFASAAPGIALVHPTSRDSLHTALRLNTAILDEIERADYDVFDGRVRVGRARQAAVGLHGLRGSWSARRADRPSEGPGPVPDL